MHLFRTLTISLAVSTLGIFASAIPDTGDYSPQGAPRDTTSGPPVPCCPPYNWLFFLQPVSWILDRESDCDRLTAIHYSIAIRVVGTWRVCFKFVITGTRSVSSYLHDYSNLIVFSASFLFLPTHLSPESAIGHYYYYSLPLILCPSIDDQY